MSSVAAKRPRRREEASPPPRTLVVPSWIDEPDLYPTHEEDHVPETPQHEALARYLKGALAARLPDRWVTGDVCMYWEKGDFQKYVAPDVLVVDVPTPDPAPSTYLRWSGAEPLIVIEVGSRSTLVEDTGPKVGTYAVLLRVPEYLYFTPGWQSAVLFRLANGGYQAVPADERGWVHSETLGLWFGVDETGWLRVYTPAGERLLSHEEAERARQEAERALQQERQAREDAERRLSELKAELEHLRVGAE